MRTLDIKRVIMNRAYPDSFHSHSRQNCRYVSATGASAMIRGAREEFYIEASLGVSLQSLDVALNNFDVLPRKLV
jgi:hypothetical protein